MKSFRLGLALSVVSLAVVAQGPAAPALTYSGFLEDSGLPVTGMRLIRVSLFGAQSGGAVLCQVPQAQVEVSNGHFQVGLNQTSCDEAIQTRDETWLEVQVGTVVFPRTRIGAVPYALVGVPRGAVMFFDLPTCPSGWELYARGLGRYLVGVDGGVGQTVGEALSPGESRAVGQHTHGVIDPGHAHPYTYLAHNLSGEVIAAGGAHQRVERGVPSTTANAPTNLRIADAGSVPGTPAPYVGLLPCMKR
jgi:hypothetical protein